MKVKVGDKIYDGHDEAVMVILTDADKKNITDMPENAYKYMQFPDTMTEDEARDFLVTEEE